MALRHAIANWIDTVGPGLRSMSIVKSPVFLSREGMDYCSLPGTIVRYRVAGKGAQTIVFAVDAPVVIEQYDRLIELLQDEFRVVVFESPGAGFSLPNTAYSFDFTAANDVVAQFLRRLGLGASILAFPCVSAYGAIDIANRYPELVAGVVAMQAPSWTEVVKWKHGRDRTGMLSRPIIGQLALKVLKRKRAPQWFDAAVGKRDMLPDFVKTADHAFAHGACFCLASAFQHYLSDTPPPLAPVRQPSLIVWGEADKSHRRTDKDSTRHHFPHAEELRLDAAGHFPELEEPELFAAALKKWAASMPAGRACTAAAAKHVATV